VRRPTRVGVAEPQLEGARACRLLPALELADTGLVPDPREPAGVPFGTVALGPDAGTFGLVRDPAELADRPLNFPSAVTDLGAVDTLPRASQA
jgi:hypothetical protein